MHWLIFTYSLPSKLRSSPRVALWRRLRRLGAVSLTGGIQVLPDREECLEAFQWLAQEILSAGGEALVMRVQQVEGKDDQDLVELFCQALREEYAQLDSQVGAFEEMLKTKRKTGQLSEARDQLAKLRHRFTEISRSDYFQCPQGLQLAARLTRIDQAFSPEPGPATKLTPADKADYQGKRWVTRPRPHVDRLACAWLIRRFIDPHAAIRYAVNPEPGEISFDMENSHFGHQGNWCSFETMRLRFGLDDPSLAILAEIVHEIDLHDGRYIRAEIAGIEAVLNGWRQAGFSDTNLEAHGLALFEGLYASFSNTLITTGKQDG